MSSNVKLPTYIRGQFSKLALKSWCFTQFEVERLKSRNRLPRTASLTNPTTNHNVCCISFDIPPSIMGRVSIISIFISKYKFHNDMEHIATRKWK